MKTLDQHLSPNFACYNADCIEGIAEMPDDSIHFSIYSPPFVGLYIYSDSERDLGNCVKDEDFYAHYAFLAKELHRVTIPGRLCAVHCKDLPLYHGRDGEAGLKDFPGELIRVHSENGWTFHSRVTIWKCPVIERERTNNNGLLHKTVLRDRSQLRQGMADYLLVFRKTPEDGMLSAAPVGEDEGFTDYVGLDECDPRKAGRFHPSPYSRSNVASNNSINIWRRYAEPVWWDINQMDVLNYKLGRDNRDEKHICPLQLDVIRRAVQLWSNPGDVVLSPFMGIGSEGFVAVEMGRKFIGFELKASYFRQAVENLQSAEQKKREATLFEV